MYPIPKQKKIMKEAILEGKKALPYCLPNPPVGCVLVKNGKIVARGFTQPPGEFHAEAHALSQYDGPYDEVSAFVTLEPCSFHGRTPSCARTFANLKLKEVYFSLLDPDPRNNGKGIQLLRDAGIEIISGVLEEEAKADLIPYLSNSNR